MTKIFFTVTNDLTYDRRMIRICTTLAESGYDVTLVGRKLKNSKPLTKQPFQQVRLNCYFEKGFLFYAFYNLQLLIFLLKNKMDAVCAIDLDTILPCYLSSRFKGSKRFYDAHELFCEMKEIKSRKFVHAFWKRIEKFCVPKFKHGYTINHFYAEAFKKMYGVAYEIIRNLPPLKNFQMREAEDFILCQGAVNEGRSFETLIPAMQYVDYKLVIAGDGNFLSQAKKLTEDLKLSHKITFTGMLTPDALNALTPKAKIGFTLFEPDAESNYYSLANRFFDYMHAGIPQICVNYPAYAEVQQKYPIAYLINNVSTEQIASAINELLHNTTLWMQLKNNCKFAVNEYNWQNESKVLINFYKKHLG